jgi:hypothetical protein
LGQHGHCTHCHLRNRVCLVKLSGKIIFP